MMFLKTRQLSEIICEKFRFASHGALGTSHISKRYAGHSQYANRKASKEASSEKRAQLIKKFQYEINKEIRFSKNANLATNTKLQTILGEAMKSNVPRASLESAIKAAAAMLDNSYMHTFVFRNPIGIIGVTEINCLHRKVAEYQTSGILKKFGFQIVQTGLESTADRIGIITCKPTESDRTSFDKALEDAILANCEEVKEVEDNLIEFQCNPDHLDSCTAKLTELGYTVENAETKFLFTELAQVKDETLIEKLDKIEDKLQAMPGFVRICFNI